MKKKVAVFANGDNYENLSLFILRLFEYSPKNSIDYYTFVWNASTIIKSHNESSSTIFDLPDLNDFDAAVIFNPGRNLYNFTEHICRRVSEAHIPTISVGTKYPAFFHVDIENTKGMRDLCNHLIEEHDVKTVKIIAGSLDNSDSNTRIKVVSECLTKHGYQLGVNDVYYSNWMIEEAEKYVNMLCQQKEKLPDALICCNDILAEITIDTLSNNGLSVPEDIIVTGFDFLEESQVFSPSISSVSQRVDVVGEETAKLLTSILNDEEIPLGTIVTCEFKPGESCGCFHARNDNELRKNYISKILYKRRYNFATTQLSDKISNAIITADCFDNMVKNLSMVLDSDTMVLGDSFYLMLDENIARFGEESLNGLPLFTFADEMRVVYGRIDGQRVDIGHVKTSDLVPKLSDREDNLGYYFIPIYYKTFICGYAVFIGRNDYIASTTFIRLESTIVKSLAYYRHSAKLISGDIKYVNSDSLT